MGGEAPSLVDLQYVSHVERIVASAMYWKGLRLRRTGRFPHLDRWLDAFEVRPAYLATKSDWYTHAMALPSQNGPGYASPDEAARQIASQIYGFDDSWSLPIDLGKRCQALEPMAPLEVTGDAAHEAAWAVIMNHERLVRFACRGAAPPGRPSFGEP